MMTDSGRWLQLGSNSRAWVAVAEREAGPRLSDS